MKLVHFVKKLFLYSKSTTVLTGVLFFAFILRIVNLNYNSAFVDEAQYIVLGQKVLSGIWQDAYPFSWIGGLPLFYPPLVALFYSYGGLLGARMLNVYLGTFSVYLIYSWTIRLKLSQIHNKKIGLLAALFLSLLSIPLYLSRNGTYDMLSFTFFLVGLVFFQAALTLKSPARDQVENRLFLSSLAFFVSFLAKYFTITFFPYLVITGILYLLPRGKPLLFKFAKFFIAPLVICSVVYIGLYFSALVDFWQSQVDRSSVNQLEIFKDFMTYALPVLILALGGLLFIRKRITRLHISMFSGGFFVLLIHLVTGNKSSLDQQLFLSLALWIPFAAYFLGKVLFWDKRYGMTIVSAIFVTIGFWSYNQLTHFETGWNNTNNVMNFIKSESQPDHLILSSEDDITVLALPTVDYNQIYGPFYMEYQGLKGIDAYKKAVLDGYFDIILVNLEREDDMTEGLTGSLLNHYQETFKEVPFVVYQKRETSATESAEVKL